MTSYNDSGKFVELKSSLRDEEFAILNKVISVSKIIEQSAFIL